MDLSERSALGGRRWRHAVRIGTRAMLRTIMILGGLLGLTFPAPTQGGQARLGNHVTIGVDLGGARQPAPPPVKQVPAGYWKEITERVWVDGACRTICHPPVWGWTCDPCGRRVWGIVRAGWTETIHEPGHYELRTRRVWVPYHQHHDGGYHRRR